MVVFDNMILWLLIRFLSFSLVLPDLLIDSLLTVSKRQRQKVNPLSLMSTKPRLIRIKLKLKVN